MDTTEYSELEIAIFERMLFSPEHAKAIMGFRLSPKDQKRMSELMTLNNQGLAGPKELEEFDALLRVGTILSILKAKARLLIEAGEIRHQPA